MQTTPARGALRETAETVLIALAIALFVRAFLVQPYAVDGQSMYPTLHDGDRLLVNKLVYRLRDPKPGEIVVLKDPVTAERRLVKRVVAVGGQTVEVRGQVLYVDGEPVEETFTNPDTLPFADVEPTRVEPGHVYVMGDNRGGSLDSRALNAIPLANVEGQAFFLFWPTDRFGEPITLRGGAP